MNNYLYYPFIIAFIWGISPVILKYFIKHNNIPVYIIILIESIVYLTATLIYISIYKINVIIGDLYKSSNYIPIIAFISLFSIYIANVLYLIAIHKGVNVNVITIFTGLYPIITLIFAFIILQETLSLKALFGFFLIMIGIVFVFYDI